MSAEQALTTVGIGESRRRINDEPSQFDELGRGRLLLGLLRTILNADPPLVIGVHGDWGSGKTSFMQILRNLLEDERRDRYLEAEKPDQGPDAARLAERAGAYIEKWKDRTTEKNKALPPGRRVAKLKPQVLTTWFNPWEHQFEDEPVLPMLDAIRQQQKSGWAKVKDRFRRIVEDPKVRIIGKAALGVARMAGAGWFSALSGQIGDEAQQVVDQFAQFRAEFEQCMDQLTASTGGKLVIFIDDLDRCEPDYALKILESLKLHLLTPHCVFVLGCAEKRVRTHLVRKLMKDVGAGGLPGDISPEQYAEEYLEKIIQMPVHLPGLPEASFQRLLRHVGWKRFAAPDSDAYQLLRTFAGDNPRKLKRFRHWYELQRDIVDSDDELKAKAGIFFSEEALFLQFCLVRFVDFDRSSEPDDFLVPEGQPGEGGTGSGGTQPEGKTGEEAP
jgi:hypothetical protein